MSDTSQDIKKEKVKYPHGRHPNSLAALKHIQPGQVLNPTGRPRKPLTEAYSVMLDAVCPHDENKRTWAEVIAEGQAMAAVTGKAESAREIADRVEGKVSDNLELNVNLVATDERVRQLIARRSLRGPS